jgi:putative transposase
VLGVEHLWTALAYVERNPVRAEMVASAIEYPWSSARAHVSGTDESGLLDMTWWCKEWVGDWNEVLQKEEDAATSLRSCTYSGRPFGDEAFVKEVGERFGRTWIRGRPRKKSARTNTEKDPNQQIALF